MAIQQPDTLDFAERTTPLSPDPGTIRMYSNSSDGLLYAINSLGVNVLASTPGSIPIVICFIINDGTAGTDIGPLLLAPRTGTISKCNVVTKTSDGSVDLTFRIKKNGVSIFGTNPTIPHGTASGTVNIFSLISTPLSVTVNDVFQIDILSGSVTWVFTAQLE